MMDELTFEDNEENVVEALSISGESDDSELRRADTIIDGRIENSTRVLYEKKNHRLVKWLKENHPECVNVDGVILPLPERVVKKYFSAVTKNLNGKYGAYATVAGYKSALQELYNSRGLEDEFPYKLAADFFKGYKRKVATLVLNGQMSLGSGKMLLSYRGYSALLKAAMNDGTTHQHGLFPALYMQLSWNLMCRTVSAGSLLYSHMTWMGDALVIHLPKHKGDPTGSRSYPKHLYANVYDPQHCPILGLAVRVLCECNRGNQKLFGEGASKRFSQWLMKTLKKLKNEQLVEMLIQRGTVNTHSFRKGAPYFTLASLLAKKLAVNFRMGKALPPNEEPYYSPEPGNDQLIGRIVCGLPTCDDRFTSLPPHFLNDEVVNAVDMSELFQGYTNYPPCFLSVLPMLLASAIYHATWLQENLPANHPLFLSRFWRSSVRTDFYESVVVGKGYCGTSNLHATGIPSEFNLANKVETLSVQLRDIREVISVKLSAPSGPVLSDIQQLMLGQHTSLEASIAALKDSIVGELRDAIASTANLQSTSRETAHFPAVRGQTYTWGGRMHPVPQSFKFPLCSTKHLFGLWYFGDEHRVPYRKLESYDMLGDAQKVNFTRAKKVMSYLGELAVEKGFVTSVSSIQTLTFKQVDELFMQLEDSIGLTVGKKRKIGDLSYGSIYNKI